MAAAGILLAACAKPQPVRYSEQMINARMSAWYNKDNCVGFPNANSTNGVTVPETAATWDYVPGVVAKGILDVWQYYQDSAWADAWYIGLAQWADSLDQAELDRLVRGGILDDLNCAKVFLGLYEGAKPGGRFENPEKAAFYMEQMHRAAEGLAEHKAKYSLPNGGWMHKATDNPEKSYWGQMWCDGAYMGPALLAQLLEKEDVESALVFSRTKHGVDRIVRDLKSGGDDLSFILSADGHFFMHERFTPDDSILEADGGAYRSIGERLLAAGDGFVEGALGGRKYIFKVSSIPMTGWLYVLGRPEREVNAYAASAVRILVAAFILLFVVITAVTVLIMQRTRAKDQDLGKNIMNEVQYLAVSAKENAATSQEQSAAVKEIVATMEENTTLSENISRKIKDVAGVAAKTRVDVADGMGLLAANVRKLNEIADANMHTIDGIKDLGAKIDNIWDIVTLINSVADQAKIIAFNAELEASAAGEAGKNFHIVATEIRRLADGIIDGTREIKERITEIQDSSDSLILASEGGTEKINEGCESAKSLEGRFSSIKNASEITADSAGDITTIIQQQTAASEQILITLRQIAAGVENFTTATEQISGAAESFKTIAGNLSR